MSNITPVRYLVRLAPMIIFLAAMIALLPPVSDAQALDWFKSAKKRQTPVSYSALMADSCTGGGSTPTVILADLPAVTAHRSPVVYAQAGHFVSQMAVSPDGRYLFSVDANSGGKLWEIDSGRLVWSVKIGTETPGFITDVSFSPDGAQLYCVAMDQNAIQVIDPLSGKLTGTIPIGPYNMPLGGRAFTDNGAAVAATSMKGDGKSGFYRLPSGEPIAEVTGWVVAISPSGAFALTREHTTYSVWDVCAGKRWKTFKLPGVFAKAAFSPDGSRVAVMRTSGLAIIDSNTGKPVWTGPENASNSAVSLGMQFSTDGKSLYFIGLYPGLQPEAASDYTKMPLLVIDAQSGGAVRTLASGVSFGALSRTPDGKFTIAGMGKKILFVDDARRSVAREIGGSLLPPGFVVAPDGYLVTASQVWNPKTGMPVAPTPVPQERIGVNLTAVLPSPDGSTYISLESLHQEQTCRVTWWDKQTGREMKTFDATARPENGSVNCRVSDNGRTLAVAEPTGRSHRVRLIDLETETTIKEITPPEGASFSIFFMKLSGNGERVAVSMESSVGVWRVRGDDEFVQAPINTLNEFTLSRDGSKLLHTTRIAGGAAGIQVLDIPSGKREVHQAPPLGDGVFHTAMVFSRDGQNAVLATSDGDVRLLDLTSGVFRKMDTTDRVPKGLVEVSPDFSRVYASAGIGFSGVHVWDTASGRELARFMAFAGGEWLSMTPDGYYASSENGDRQLNVRVGFRVQGIGQYFETFYRPDLVAENLQKSRPAATPSIPARKTLAAVAVTGAPPTVVFDSPVNDATLDKRDVEVIARVIDNGGGVGKIEWKINGVTIGLDREADRGIAVSGMPATKMPPKTRKRLLTLSPGLNEIRVTAFSGSGEIQSAPALLTITCQDEISSAPSLFLLSVGINKYRDGALRLNFSVPDAEAISAAFSRHSRNVFKEINIKTVFDENATLQGIQEAFADAATAVNPQDVFVLYVAGHGVTQEGRYFLLPHEFRYRNEASIAKNGISQEHLQQWLATIQARKSIVFLDTCNSGSFARSTATTRGLEEKSAIARLTRATGRAVIVAAKDDQPALEGYENHGVFTYALLNAFEHADRKFGNRDRQTSIFEIAAYIDENVPEITYKQFGYEQIPQVSMQGRDFPIALVE